MRLTPCPALPPYHSPRIVTPPSPSAASTGTTVDKDEHLRTLQDEYYFRYTQTLLPSDDRRQELWAKLRTQWHRANDDPNRPSRRSHKRRNADTTNEAIPAARPRGAWSQAAIAYIARLCELSARQGQGLLQRGERAAETPAECVSTGRMPRRQPGCSLL